MPLQHDFFLHSVRIEPRRLCFIVQGETRSVEPLAMRILEVLADADGKVVTREEIIDAVWPDGYAGEGSLSRAIWSLRQALGDDARAPEYIETVPRVGYRLKAPVRRALPAGSDEARVLHTNRRLKRTVAALVVALIVVSAGWGIEASTNVPSYEHFLKVKRPDGTVDSLHLQSETPIAFSSNLLDK